MLRYLDAIAPSTAASRSASSNTMNGALPPSSSETFLTVRRALRHQLLADLGRAGERELAHDRVRRELAADRAGGAGDDVEHALRECRRARRARHSASAEYGVIDAGLITIVQPAASAGPALRVIIAFGKFHGVIAAHTPIGCLITTMRRSGACGRDGVAVDALAPPRRTTR